MLKVCIVDPTESSRESLRALLLSVDFVWMESESNRYEYFGDVIRQSTPDLAIVSLDGDQQRALHTIQQLAAEHPKLAILTISKNHQALLLSLQKGAKYFLTEPVELEDLLSALRRAVGDAGGLQDTNASSASNSALMPKQGGPATVIAVLGSRGGVGTTTLAVNLAATLANDPDNAVALIDLDLALGDADIAVEVQGMENISIADVARNIQRLDMNYLKRALVKHEATGLSILRHPLEIQDMSQIHEAHVERIVNLLKISYTHLILDLSKSFLPTDLMGLELADQILLVAQLELGSLRNVVRLNHLLNNPDDARGDRVKIIVNRVGAESVEEGISLKKAEEVIGRPIYWQIPNDSKSVIAARVAGQPLVKHAPKSKIQQNLHGLAQTLSGKAMAGAPGDKDSKKGWFSFGKK
ncbi:AAA family ATPase [Limnoglobus roseus]|uniref:Pilus assembly protein CpaE n=1 Tax=Limnoglobus roseus TaxID=2598579 RepID=A0A5C1A4H5_9BACT|nr:AAA family ATPase [Limnoglobus roseus]QEL13223.1 pilus assembly protein CpaE [Limnoglobus roseus]